MAEPLSRLRPYVVGIPKKPSDMSRQEAEAEFNRLLVSRLPELTDYFEGVLTEVGIDLTGPSAEVLTHAGEWLVGQARLVRSRSLLPSRFQVEDDDDLSVPTKSACCYFGLVFGERIIEDVPGTAWTLVTDNKRDMDYHRAVIRPANNHTQLEPIRIAMTFVQSRLENPKNKRPFAELYDIWRKALSQS